MQLVEKCVLSSDSILLAYTSMKKEFSFGTQVRKSPYFDATVRWGAQGFSVYNHMYIPRDFGDPAQNFWNLVNNNAANAGIVLGEQRHAVDAFDLRWVGAITSRNGEVEETGLGAGVLNDPVESVAENHFWLSLADSDILMWAKGVAVNSGLDVNLGEPDVSPLQLQGPKSGDIAKAIFGERIDSLKYYWLEEFELNGIPLIISRTGWSSELGYEIYLRDGSRGNELWDHIMEIGKPMGLVPGHTSTIRRIEGGMLSYQADMDYTVNPFELGLDRLVDLEMDADFIGKDALKKIQSEGVKRRQVGVEISCPPLQHPNTSYWPIFIDSSEVGYITSAVYSPRLDKNIALAIIDVDYSAIDMVAETRTSEGNHPIKVVQKPFYDPKKKITSAS